MSMKKSFDEKYFILSNSDMKGNDVFYMDNLEDCPGNVTYKYKAKFEDKILIWCPFSNRNVDLLLEEWRVKL